MAEARVVRATGAEGGQQGLAYFEGISAESAGATGLCLHLGTIPPGGSAEPHLHDGHESAIYLISGRVGFDWGERLERHEEMGPGDFAYIPAGMPHRPYNLSEDEPVAFLVARTDPNEQESVVLLPGLGG